jgi:molybdopterin biosynthesis enzyme MoaB
MKHVAGHVTINCEHIVMNSVDLVVSVGQTGTASEDVFPCSIEYRCIEAWSIFLDKYTKKS